MRHRYTMNGRSGLIADLSPDQLPPDAASFVENFFESSEGWFKADGYRKTVLTTPNEKTHISYWAPSEGDSRWFIAGSASVMYYHGLNLTDATRPADEGGAYHTDGEWSWTSLDFNGVLVYNNSVDQPQYFHPRGTFSNFPDIDEKVRFRVLRKYKSYLFGLGVNMGAGFNDNEVYWSHPADPGTLPPNWDFANPSSDAGRTFLSSEGFMLDALELGDSLFIYKSDAIWVVRFVGGQFVFNFAPKWTSQGLLSTGCVAAFDSKHFIVTQTDIMVHNGATLTSVAEAKVKKFFFKDLSRDFFHRTFVVLRPDENDVYLMYPSRGSEKGFVDSALVWNWTTKVWSYRKLPEIAHAAFGSSIPEKVETWDQFPGPWEQEGSWRGGQDARTFTPALYFGLADAEQLYTTSYDGLNNGAPISAIWERIDLVLGTISRDGQMSQNYKNYKTISSIAFDVETTESFNVFLGTRDYLNSPVIWEDYGEFDPRQQNTLDLILTTGFLSLRIVTLASGMQLRNLHITFEMGGEIV